MLLSSQNIFLGSGGLYLKSNCGHFSLLCSTLMNCNASWSRFSIYTCSVRLVCWSSDRKIGYVCSIPFPLLSPVCSVKSFLYSAVNIPHSSVAVCRVLSQSNGTFDSRDPGRGGRSNQWNLPVKWLAGTKLYNLPGLEMAHGWEPPPRTNLFTKPFYLHSLPCCLLHILWKREISLCQNGVRVSISGVPPRYSGLSHSVGHAVSNKELEPSNDALRPVGNLLPVIWVSCLRLFEMNIVNPVKSLSAFEPWLKHGSLWIFHVAQSVKMCCNENRNHRYTNLYIK